MSIKHYPILLIIHDDIELIENQDTLKESTYGIDKKEFKDIFVIYENGECYSLDTQQHEPFCLVKLTKLVQQSLIDEGHCCVEKVKIIDTRQAFHLLQGST
ncbi:DUF4144 family protein [Pseudoalteromonas citrea]|uniref:Uncharacterized protein n=1 Tax=Pseudoalteromonas citrea DSM 8771 TaxID=1117314 RepID=U1KTS3_9GAMM|nr:DUF4144 family protein [Pseudoalteromonas citrea]